MANLNPNKEKLQDILINFNGFDNEIKDNLLYIPDSEFEEVKELTKKYNISFNLDNIACIYKILKNYSYDLDSLRILKNDPIGEEQKDFFKFLKADDTIKEILFKTNGGNNFTIKDPSLVLEILRLIQAYYPNDYAKFAAYKGKEVRTQLALNLYNYFNEFEISKNKIYSLIGELFILSGLQNIDITDSKYYSDTRHIQLKQYIKANYF